MCHWLAKYNCTDVCMESTGKYWIPVFNILERNNIRVTLSQPKYTKFQKGNKTDRKDAKWIFDLYMCKSKAFLYNILTDLKPYTPEGFLKQRPVYEPKSPDYFTGT